MTTFKTCDVCKKLRHSEQIIQEGFWKGWCRDCHNDRINNYLIKAGFPTNS